MNYRHGFHAGNFADVVKHAILTLILGHLRAKETPFCVLDTHAGIGRYDLTGEQAVRTGEAKDGVLKLIAGDTAAPELAAYIDLLRDLNPGWPDLRLYPGSPAIVRALLRPQDRLVAVELHPEEARDLKHLFRSDKQVAVHEADAYTALKAHLPPKERRGLVLIDPPFEQPDEFRRLSHALPEAVQRFRTGVFAIWYPIKAVAPVEQFRAEIARLGRPALAAEFYRYPPDNAERLNGMGLAIVNPPWKLDETLERLLPVLAKALGATGGTKVIDIGGTATSPPP
ncbi:MAG TPA: 23S rRNA (adenine(2030)-N(6))-methyltransferase RlmJ [Magnetospirillaceae bacterium]|jgi:23S rRNA (adenine2030-N6)-methyltransferase